jgi:hypothetical protein
MAPGIDSHHHSKAKQKTIGGLAMAPGIDPHDQDYSEEETTEITNPTYQNYRSAPRVGYESEDDDSGSCLVPGAFRMGGNSDDDDVTYETESVDRRLSPPEASSTALLLLQAELAPDIDEEIALAVTEAFREREQNTLLATTVEVINEDGKAEPTRSLSRRWKLATVMLVLFVIGTVATFSIVFPRKDEPTAPPTAPPNTTSPTTAPPTKIRFSIMADVIGSSFEDDFFPSSTLQEDALIWLADEDPAHLAVDTDSTTLLERYTAALFYIATQGTLWTSANRWLSKDPVCSWEGLNCNDQGFLARMNLGTCLLASFCL